MGGNVSHFNDYTETAELYDPTAGTWSPTTSMESKRVGHSSTLLQNGKVLVAFGSSQDEGVALSNAEIYDFTKGTWSPAVGH